MILKVEQQVALACTFLWAGFICAISFMESWLKFRVPGVTLPIGLGIGRVVFNALNKVEWIFAIAILCCLVWSRSLFTWQNCFFFFILVILVLQTFWLLPDLDKRATAIINGNPAGASNTHLYFIAGEVLKLTCLMISGIYLFKQS